MRGLSARSIVWLTSFWVDHTRTFESSPSGGASVAIQLPSAEITGLCSVWGSDSSWATAAPLGHAISAVSRARCRADVFRMAPRWERGEKERYPGSAPRT